MGLRDMRIEELIPAGEVSGTAACSMSFDTNRRLPLSVLFTTRLFTGRSKY